MVITKRGVPVCKRRLSQNGDQHTYHISRSKKLLIPTKVKITRRGSSCYLPNVQQHDHIHRQSFIIIHFILSSLSLSIIMARGNWQRRIELTDARRAASKLQKENHRRNGRRRDRPPAPARSAALRVRRTRVCE